MILEWSKKNWHRMAMTRESDLRVNELDHVASVLERDFDLDKF